MADFFQNLPPEIATEYEALERKKRIQDALMADTMRPHQTEFTPGRYSRAVPKSPIEGIAKVIQAALLKKHAGETDKQMGNLGQKYQGDSDEVIRNMIAQSQGDVPWRNPDPTGAAMSGAGSPYSAAQNVSKAMMQMTPEPPKPYNLAPGAQRYSGSNQLVAANPKTMPETQIINNMPGVDKFADEWAKMEVGNYGENMKSAESASLGIEAMNRFMENNDLASEGAVQPLFTFFKNFMSSFGMDSQSLTAETIMDQSAKGTLAQYMRELGARGLTDTDMKILAQVLPQLNTSKEARMEVANIMMKNYDKTLSTFSDRFETLATKPEVSHMAYKPLFLKNWEKQKTEGTDNDLFNEADRILGQ